MDEKIKELMENEEFVSEMFSKEEPEDVQKLFADNGVELTLEEIKDIGKAFEKIDIESGELSEDDLEEVAGGVNVRKVIEGAGAMDRLVNLVKRNWRRIRNFFRRW